MRKAVGRSQCSVLGKFLWLGEEGHGHTSKHIWVQSIETYGFTRCPEMFRILQAGVCRCTVDPLTKDPSQDRHITVASMRRAQEKVEELL